MFRVALRKSGCSFNSSSRAFEATDAPMIQGFMGDPRFQADLKRERHSRHQTPTYFSKHDEQAFASFHEDGAGEFRDPEDSDPPFARSGPLEWSECRAKIRVLPRRLRRGRECVWSRSSRVAPLQTIERWLCLRLGHWPASRCHEHAPS